MMRIGYFFAWICVLGGMLLANDGVNRYRKVVPTTLHLFPQPVSPQAGYAMLDHDDESGADGDVRYRWAQRHAVALVRICAFETARDLGVGDHPLMVFDLSAENGDTAINWGEKPIGRHPGNSHDGGINLDLGYYLTSLAGRVRTPDYAACTEHYVRQTDGTWKDEFMCLDRADRLDTPRMSRFLLALFRIHLDCFGGGLLEEIGIDFQVRNQVLEQVSHWAQRGKYGSSPAIVSEMKRVFTCDAYEGWQKYHHHHVHLRLRDLDYAGSFRTPLEEILARDRQNESDLRRAQGEEGPFLRLSLLSTDLSRAIEAELLPTGEHVANLRFRLDEGEWQGPEAADPRNRKVFDLPQVFSEQAGKAKVRAEFTDSRGNRRSLEGELLLPPLDVRLKIAIEPGRLNCTVSIDGGKIRLVPEFPAFYRNLLTQVSLVVTRSGGESPESVPLEGPGKEAVIESSDDKPVILIELRAACAGRRVHLIPVYVRDHGITGAGIMETAL